MQDKLLHRLIFLKLFFLLPSPYLSIFVIVNSSLFANNWQMYFIVMGKYFAMSHKHVFRYNICEKFFCRCCCCTIISLGWVPNMKRVEIEEKCKTPKRLLELQTKMQKRLSNKLSLWWSKVTGKSACRELAKVKWLAIFIGNIMFRDGSKKLA